MKLVFVSNMLNHHQLSLCEELNKRFQDFYFVSTENTKQIGYQKACEMNYVLHYSKENEKAKVEEIILNADVVLYGGCPNELIELRMQKNKLSFLYSERFFKKGIWRSFIPQTRKKVNERLIRYKNKNMYVLCASAYLSNELALLGFPIKKCFKWGYFPEFKNYELNNLLSTKRKNCKIVILWVGRLLSWKHPESALLLAEKLKDSSYEFEMNIIGDGEQRQKLERMLNDKQLNDCVHLLGSMEPERVREYMEKSNVFVGTSDFYEGWGAVLNEAMNSGCAVVVSHSTGAAPFLIKDGQNGLLYENGNIEQLYQKVAELIKKSNLTELYGEKAYLTMKKVWNATEAADRLFYISSKLLHKQDISVTYEEGPCSMAEKFKNNWYL